MRRLLSSWGSSGTFVYVECHHCNCWEVALHTMEKWNFQVAEAVGAVSSADSAEAALNVVDGLLAKDRVPFSNHLQWLRARLLLQLQRYAKL